MSFISPSSNPVHVKDEVLVFVHLRDLDVLVHFGFVNNFAVPLVVGTLLIDIILGMLFRMERHLVPIPTRAALDFRQTHHCQIYWLYHRSTRTLTPLLRTERTIAEGHSIFRREVHDTFAKYITICISHDTHRCTYLNDSKSKFSMEPNGSASLSVLNAMLQVLNLRVANFAKYTITLHNRMLTGF